MTDSTPRVPDVTPADVLACPMDGNDAGADSIRTYLVALLDELWKHGEDWVKRPFGNSGWQYELYGALAKQGHITGTFDEDGYVDDVDSDAGDRLVTAAVKHLYTEGVAAGCTAATAGAPVSPVQTTDHAELSVSGVTDNMVEVVARALAETAAEATDTESFRVTDRHRRDARDVLTDALAGCTAVPEPPERGDMALRMAQARQWIAHRSWGGVMCPPWDGLTPDEREQAETEARHWINAAVNAGVKIVPAGCTVVELPEPDGTSYEGDPIWNAHVDYEETIFACVQRGEPVVESAFSEGPMAAVTAEMLGLRLLAAAREARRLAGSVSPKGDNTDG